MVYRVELTQRAERDLEHLCLAIDADNSAQAQAWFNRLEEVILSLEKRPARGTRVAEDPELRQVLYGRKPNVYRIIYAVDEPGGAVRVLHIRHGRRRPAASGDDMPSAR